MSTQRRFPIATVRVLAACVLLVVATSCEDDSVSSREPVFDPKLSQFDEKLAGIWYDLEFRIFDTPLLPAIFEITRDPRPGCPGGCRLDEKSSRADAKAFEAFCSDGAGMRSLCLELEKPEKRYVLVPYTLKDNTFLAMRRLDAQAIKQEISSGKLKGKEGTVPMLTEPPEKIREWIQTKGEAATKSWRTYRRYNVADVPELAALFGVRTEDEGIAAMARFQGKDVGELRKDFHPDAENKDQPKPLVQLKGLSAFMLGQMCLYIPEAEAKACELYPGANRTTRFLLLLSLSLREPGQQPSQAWQKTVLGALEENDKALRGMAAVGLLNAGQNVARAVNTLLDLADAGVAPDEVPLELADLSSREKIHEYIISRVAEALTNEKVADEVGAAVGRAGAKGAPVLQNLLKELQQAVAATPDSAEAVIQRRKAAASALGRLGPAAAAALPQLKELAEKDPDAKVREAAKEAVKRISGK
ncbi:MAG TPA: HEAT repeat domain-containing protein [Planctomycetota bacterium]|jgi:hypothetical protein